MLRKPKEQKLFIEINFAPRKKRRFFAYFEEVSLNKQDIFLYSLSILTFSSIFILSYIADNFIQKQQEKIKNLNKQINITNSKIRTIQSRLSRADNRFKTFYIPKLKEKIFVYWYSKWYRGKVVPTIKEFQKLIKGAMPYMGVWVYPNPFRMGRTIVETSFLPKGIIEYKRINGNPFYNPRYLNYLTLPNLFLYVKGPKVDSKFAQLLSKIRDRTIKANLLLEYALLKYPLSKFSYSSVTVLLFPINLVEVPKAEGMLNKLKNYCNALIINKEARRSVYLNNKWQTSKVLEGVCIKYAF